MGSIGYETGVCVQVSAILSYTAGPANGPLTVNGKTRWGDLCVYTHTQTEQLERDKVSGLDLVTVPLVTAWHCSHVDMRTSNSGETAPTGGSTRGQHDFL